MEALKKFKELIVNVEQGNKSVQSLRLPLDYGVKDTQAEKMFNALALLSGGTVSMDLNYIHRNIIKVGEGGGSGEVTPPPVDPGTEDQVLTLLSMEAQIENVILADEDIYGPEFDGEGANYVLIWKDGQGTEHIVPRDGLDEFTAMNPNKAYAYNSEGSYIQFATRVSGNVDYILRKVK